MILLQKWFTTFVGVTVFFEHDKTKEMNIDAITILFENSG